MKYIFYNNLLTILTLYFLINGPINQNYFKITFSHYFKFVVNIDFDLNIQHLVIINQKHRNLNLFFEICDLNSHTIQSIYYFPFSNNMIKFIIKIYF